MGKGMKEKGEGMVYVYHHCHGQGVPIEWYELSSLDLIYLIKPFP